MAISQICELFGQVISSGLVLGSRWLLASPIPSPQPPTKPDITCIDVRIHFNHIRSYAVADSGRWRCTECRTDGATAAVQTSSPATDMLLEMTPGYH
jgi:hypothetical protein